MIPLLNCGRDAVAETELAPAEAGEQETKMENRNWVALTDADGQPTWINMSTVQQMYQEEGLTVLVFGMVFGPSGNTAAVYVREQPQDILSKLFRTA
jgi:hypothetical protein